MNAYSAFTGHADQAFGHLTYAQFGEDMIIANIFAMLGIARPTYLDIGAHHPLNCSNTALLYARGSRGICVEANPNCIQAFRDLRPEDITLNIGVGPERVAMDFYYIDHLSGRNTFDRKTAMDFVAANPRFSISTTQKVEVVTINDVVESYCSGAWPDFLSLDIEGLDLAVLRSARFGEYGPTVICVEAVSGSDTDATFLLMETLTSHGYTVYSRTLGNLICTRSMEQVKSADPAP